MAPDNGAAVDSADESETVAGLRARLGDLDALLRLAEAIARARSLEETLEEALTALTAALGLDRASILLADAGGVMRFRAWRNLSIGYRAAADGHSPWPPDATDPQPVLVRDVLADGHLAEFRETIVGEGIRALAFVPLVHRGRLLGKVLLLRPEPHDFTERELRLATAMANHVAAATERYEALGRLAESRNQLEVVLRAVADGITVQDTQGRLVYANDAAARLTGFTFADELLSASIPDLMARFELLDENREPLPYERLPGRLALAGAEAPEQLVCYRVKETGEEHWSIVRATPVRDDDGTVRFAVNAFHEITDRRRSEERSAFLAEAGVLLSSSLDYEETLRSVARLAVPRTADWCIVYMLQEDGSLRRLALEHAGDQGERVREVLDRHPLDPDAPGGVPRVVRTGEPELVPDISAAELSADTQGADSLAAELDFLALGSYMCVPLKARGRTLGAITLLSGASGRVFGADDLALVEELAARAGLAVDNARLYREAERALASLESLLGSASVGIGFWDTDLRYVRVNRALAEINGLPAEEHVGKTLHEVIPTLADRVEPLYRRVLETGEPIVHAEVTGELASRPGVKRHWLTSYYPVRTPDGETLGMGAVILELTERRRAEEELQHQSRLLSTIADNAHSALFMMDRRGRPTYMNPAAAAITGWTLDEIGDRSLHDVLHHTRPDGTPYPVDECPTGRVLDEPRRLEAREDVFFRKDGSSFPVLVAASPIVRDGAIVGAVLEMRDITEQKRAEAERLRLLESEQAARHEAEARAQASQALHYVADGVFLVDRDGLVRLWNTAAAAITGRAAEAVEGRTAEDALPGLGGLLARVPVVPAGPAPPPRPETLPLEVDGRELWLSISGVEFELGTVFAFRDITHEHGLEKMKTDFVSTVSHELRTPLAAIYGAAVTLRRPDMPLVHEQRDELLRVIGSEADRLARIVNDILWSSRLELEAVQITIEHCDAVELARGIVDAARLNLPPATALDLRAEEGLPLLAADPDKVRQVLANLVENALKYSPGGGRVQVCVERSSGGLRFVVEDEGLGIPPAERERIFEKFYRLDPDLTRGVGGTGLGLYICRELVRRMNGRIRVEDGEPRGSRFVVELPAADAAAS